MCVAFLLVIAGCYLERLAQGGAAAIQSTVAVVTTQYTQKHSLVVTKLWIATPALPALVAPETRVRKDEKTFSFFVAV